MNTSPTRLSWDIFCTVVDNFGDIGVCWRLARQLVRDQGQAVRLWVDNLASFRRICPEVDPTLSEQEVGGVRIGLWADPFPEVPPAQVVIEAFACRLPANYLATMATQEVRPVWINLEYLSAEPWVAGCHGMASPHPTLPLVQYFYFPGFTVDTGGLLREADLISRRREFLTHPERRLAFLSDLGVRPAPAEVLVSLFCYDHQPISGLLDAWAEGSESMFCLVPEGPALAEISTWSKGILNRVGDSYSRGQLRLQVIPFLRQENYDPLLWCCDLNFVRGEDSFVRAQWAAHPLVWQIYPQEDEAHQIKLEAFLALYAATLPSAVQSHISAFWKAWNTGGTSQAFQQAWLAYWQHRQLFADHARYWAEHLESQTDLAAGLVQFCLNKL
ncbi:MAG TPA: elongation factor P maturation arginine rhamnosyltransferase EarP [Azospira sp.]|nr:elongation factor P maturation arginine rhamnosyltransferase EarP [Azospira sp.]